MTINALVYLSFFNKMVLLAYFYSLIFLDPADEILTQLGPDLTLHLKIDVIRVTNFWSGPICKKGKNKNFFKAQITFLYFTLIEYFLIGIIFTKYFQIAQYLKSNGFYSAK